MERFDWERTKQYWRSQRGRAGDLDRAEDPDALGNVCHAGAPLWLNQYYARHQRRVFEELLAICPRPVAGARALDVGCGAGRWCRLLAARGYAVHGVDLQPALIDENRTRYPDMRFDCVPVQELVAEQPYDLITTVTVIQHLPADEQARAIGKIGALLQPGGHVIALENVADQGEHVFANSIDGWTRLFAGAGLSLVELRRYDYSPALRASNRLMRAALPRGRTQAPAAPQAVPNGGAGRSALGAALRRVAWGARHAAVAIDDRLEPILIRLNAPLPTVHCGFLFRKH
jgi:SAM-dependent methyltransferase